MRKIFFTGESRMLFKNEKEHDAALRKCKTVTEARNIVQSLEARMAPPSWIEKALNRLYQLTDEEVKRKND